MFFYDKLGQKFFKTDFENWIKEFTLFSYLRFFNF